MTNYTTKTKGFKTKDEFTKTKNGSRLGHWKNMGECESEDEDGSDSERDSYIHLVSVDGPNYNVEKKKYQEKKKIYEKQINTNN